MDKVHTDAPLSAVVTPVYNGAEFLEETMACVQAQTYGNVVHVVLDNASTDATPDIISRFEGGRVPIIRERNTETVPQRDNWNLAVALVPGEARYFQILCADDLLTNDAVEKLVAVAEADPAVELVGCVKNENGRIEPSGLPGGQSIFDGAMVARSFLNKTFDDIPHMFGLFRNHGRTETFFDHPYWSFDTDACLRALSRGKFGFVHEPLHFTRIHDGQLSATVHRKNRVSVWESLIEIRRWAPKVMSSLEAENCSQRHLRVIYRYMLAWRFLGQRETYAEHMNRLRNLDIRPGLFDYVQSVIEWPLVELTEYLNARTRRKRWLVSQRRTSDA